jgi:hypothetical protein
MQMKDLSYRRIVIQNFNRIFESLRFDLSLDIDDRVQGAVPVQIFTSGSVKSGPRYVDSHPRHPDCVLDQILNGIV